MKFVCWNNKFFQFFCKYKSRLGMFSQIRFRHWWACDPSDQRVSLLMWWSVIISKIANARGSRWFNHYDSSRRLKRWLKSWVKAIDGCKIIQIPDNDCGGAGNGWVVVSDDIAWSIICIRYNSIDNNLGQYRVERWWLGIELSSLYGALLTCQMFERDQPLL